jgi:hypothetical protein
MRAARGLPPPLLLLLLLLLLLCTLRAPVAVAVAVAAQEMEQEEEGGGLEAHDHVAQMLHDAVVQAAVDDILVEEVVLDRRSSSSLHPLRAALRKYDSLLRNHYHVVSFAQASTLGITGDVLAQGIERMMGRSGGADRPRGSWLRLRRTAQVGVLSMVIDGLMTPRYYQLLEKLSRSRSFLVAALKTAAGSLLYGPLANGLFLAGIPLLRYGRKIWDDGFDWAVWQRQLLIATIRDVQVS